MNPAERIIKNIFSSFTGSFISTILIVLTSIYIARFLGDALFGQYSFVVTFVALFSVFLDLGYETLLIRDVAKDKSKASEYLNNVISFRAILSIIVFAIIFLLINVLNFPENVKFITYLFGLSQIIISLSNLFRVTFRAFERMDYEAGLNILTNIIKFSFVLLVLLLGYGLNGIALVFLYAAIIDFILCLLLTEKKFVRTKAIFDFSFIKRTIKIAFPIGLVAFFGLIYVRIDTIMLSFMKGDAVVGWYNAAYNLILGFSPIPMLFMNALLPFMAYTYVKSKNSLVDVYEKSFKFLFFIGLPMTVGIFLLSNQFIILFYGQDFLNSVTALQVLSWDILLKFLYLCIWFLLISVGKQNELAIISGIGAVMNILLNLILIPDFSLVGAAIATIITESVILLLFIYLTFRNNLNIPITKNTIKPLISCSIMAIFIIYFINQNLYLLISLSIIIYFGTFYLLKGFSKSDIALIKKMIRKE